jgi:hypothetical protein
MKIGEKGIFQPPPTVVPGVDMPVRSNTDKGVSHFPERRNHLILSDLTIVFSFN